MGVTGGNFIVFCSGGDSIGLDDIDSGLDILQAKVGSKKINFNKF